MSGEGADRIGVFGGTFDPPHVGHLIVASEVFDALSLDRLLLVPSASPPHKYGKVAASAEQRVAMLEAAVGEDERFEVDDLELKREGPSYSVDTLREMRDRFPGAELFFVVGVDQLREFDTWRAPEEVARLARLVGITRHGEHPTEVPGVQVKAVEVTRIDLSATDIRRRVREGKSIRYLVTEPVRELIERVGLYR